MPSRPERCLPRWPAATAGALSLLLTACSLWQQPPPPAPPPPPPPPQAAPAPPPPPPPPPVVDPADAAARRFFDYHEQLRRWSQAEVAQELSRVNAQVAANAAAVPPGLVLELALLLAQNRANGDTARALAALEPLARGTDPGLAPWQPLARLLSNRLAEQRRLEEQVERQNGQLREAQRNLQQTQEKLEALKAIERSLNAPRPAGGGAAPAPAAAPSSAPKP